MIRSAFALVVLLATPLFGDGAPYLVRDFPGSLAPRGSLFDDSMWTTTGNTSWFVADRRDGFGRQLWKTDGTEEGTVQVTQIAARGTGHAQRLVGVVNGRLIYGGDSSAGGRLFAVDLDGGQWNTLMHDTTTQAGFGGGVMYKGELYFRAGGVPGNRTGTAIGKTDGTPAGTSFLNLNPGLVDYNVGSQLTVVGDSIVFAGETEAGWGVFLTDGTIAGTRKIVPVRSGTTNLIQAAIGNKLLFLVDPATTNEQFNNEVWITDGTVEGTRLFAGSVEDFQGLGVLDGRLLMRLEKKDDPHTTWITDAALAGIEHFVPVDDSLRYFNDRALIDGKYFYLAPDGSTSSSTDYVLFTTAGLAGPTVRVIGGIENVYGTYAANGRFYFVARDAQLGTEWWSSDGTAAGTHVAADIAPGWAEGFRFGAVLTRPDGLLVAAFGRMGYEPWLLDGTPERAKMLKDIAIDISEPSSNPLHLSAGRDLLFYIAVDGYDRVVGRSNGSAGGTRLAAVRPYDFWTPTTTVASGNRYYISSYIPPNAQVFSTDGTDAGTVVLSDNAVGGELYAFRDGILFTDRISDNTMFSDGTLSGTRIFAPADAGRLILTANGVAWFVRGSSIAFTDGVAPMQFVTPAGAQISTVVLATAGPANTMYFVDYAVIGVYRLWRSDGTVNGTRIVKDFNGVPHDAIASADKLFFTFNGALWVTDGTEANTVSLPATGHSSCVGGSNPAVAGNQVFWYMLSESGKQTLWQSDGTAAGTINRLTYTVSALTCRPVVAFEGRVYFSAFTSEHGEELWVSDGTSEGTHIVADIFPGVRGSEPRSLTSGAGHLFFTADSPGKGRELWAIGDRGLPRRRGVRK